MSSCFPVCFSGTNSNQYNNISVIEKEAFVELFTMIISQPVVLPQNRYIFYEFYNLKKGVISTLTSENYKKYSLDKRYKFCIKHFNTLAIDIENLDLTGRKLKMISKEFSKLKVLQILSIEDTAQEDLTPIFNIKSLMELNASRNKLTHIQTSMQNLTLLTKLSLYDNEIQVFPTSLFLPNLVELDIRKNKFDILPPDFFGNFPALRTLDFTENEIFSVPFSKHPLYAGALIQCKTNLEANAILRGEILSEKLNENTKEVVDDNEYDDHKEADVTVSIGELSENRI